MLAKDLYETVSKQIVETLEKGELPPWRKPWSGGGGFLPLRHNGTPYRGINVVILWMEAEIKGYASNQWLTFKQALEYGGAVKKGEKSTAILWCEPRTKTKTADDGTEAESRFWIAKTYRVFNASQCQGLPERFTSEPTHQLDPAQRIENADTFVKNTGARIEHAGYSAHFSPLSDKIRLPAFEHFESPQAYHATAFHELAHWTGVHWRLNRFTFVDNTTKEYAQEEIVAELSSCFLAAQLGIEPLCEPDHAAYLDFWIKAIKEDPKYIFHAASKAQQVCDYLNGLQPQP